MKKRKDRAKSVFAPVLQSVLISVITYVLLLGVTRSSTTSGWACPPAWTYWPPRTSRTP